MIRQEKYNKINSIIGSKSVTETIDKVNTTLNEKANLIAKNNELTSKLSVLEANEIIKNSAELKDFSILVEYLKDASREMMVSILDIVKQKMNGKYLIVFIGQEANGSYPIVISGSKDNGQNGNLILRGLNEKFTTSGGGRPDFVNGIIKSNDKVAILEEIKKLVK
jgi:alanyl-tRNA synthetase